MSGITLMFIGREAGAFAFTISSNQTNANLATLATAAGWNGSSALTATIGSGVYISSNSTGTPALTVNGSFPGGVTLINNGFIVGMGGAGGNGSRVLTTDAPVAGSAGSAGGLAFSVSSTISVTNNGTIAGGGGGGGGGRGVKANIQADGCDIRTGGAGGGGGGGGRSSVAANSSGGAGAVPSGFYNNASGSNGSAGTSGGSGGGGSGGSATGNIGTITAGAGGSGATWGSSGSSGGGASSSGTTTVYGPGPYGGGSGGGAVSGNSNITWLVTGTRLGSIT